MEENNKKKLDFSIGIFDNISEKIIARISEQASLSDFYAIGVYTNEYVINNYMTYPMNSQEERLENAKKIPGVNFTFLVNTTNRDEIKSIIETKYIEYLKNNC